MRIDLGSGKNKYRDCIGIDRINFKETDMIHDFNRRIPLERDSVTFVMCSHSLQYVDNLQSVMQDIYRICRHGAIVCIVAPYAHATVNMINPEFKQLFNEHSPGYWTAHENPAYQDEYPLSGFNTVLPQTPNNLAPVDFRLLRMEFFYYPAYHGFYDEVELAYLRQSQLNVAFQVMYHLIVVKKPVTSADLLNINPNELEEPDYVKEQRAFTLSDEEQEQPLYLDLLQPAAVPKEQISGKQRKPPVARKKGTGSKSKTRSHQKSRHLKSGGRKKPVLTR
ncbi:class I SAM-dependent methyltransferase [Paenibacillus sp. HW567]|uniref:class I SAM-dependent methyltransferase n=1 Tax=Paenibacillus sp. HW567 TaxID=1034769 RepID=UPI000365F29D|nr:methyltransferase domain-containing protein [Paenibacillus sp. HW567]